jgi:hypothetical protein
MTCMDHTAPRAKPNWLAMNRRQRQQHRRENLRRREEAMEARLRPESNVPPISAAEVDAGLQHTRDRVDKMLHGARIVYPEARRAVREIIAAGSAYQHGANAVEIGLRQLLELVRREEQVKVEGTTLKDTTLKELDALSPAVILLNAIADALAGKPGTFSALLPSGGDSSATPPPAEATPPAADTAAQRRACVAAGLVCLTVGKAERGGISQSKAAECVRDEFRQAGIDVTAGTAKEWFKRQGRPGGDPAAKSMFDKLVAPMRSKAKANWPIEDRKALLKQLAESSGRILEM